MSIGVARSGCLIQTDHFDFKYLYLCVAVYSAQIIDNLNRHVQSNWYVCQKPNKYKTANWAKKKLIKSTLSLPTTLWQATGVMEELILGYSQCIVLIE